MSWYERFEEREDQQQDNPHVYFAGEILEGIALGLSPIAFILVMWTGQLSKTNPYPFIGALGLFGLVWVPYIVYRYFLLVDCIVYATFFGKER